MYEQVQKSNRPYNGFVVKITDSTDMGLAMLIARIHLTKRRMRARDLRDESDPSGSARAEGAIARIGSCIPH